MRQARERAGLRPEWVAVKLDIGLRMYQKYEYGEVEPSIERLSEFADIVGEPIITFFQGEGSNFREPVQLFKVPVVNSIPAGGFIKSYGDLLAENYTLTRINLVGAFGLIVEGDSMAPRIEHGDIAICAPDRPFVDGKIYAIVANDSEATLKKVKKTKGGYLCIPLNSQYDPILVPEDKMIKLYRVLEVTKHI